uniref:Uncharacterized protein n=1 Tax=Anopheles merus TaxID=30066 RepID=A0A182VK39_ANOME
MARRRRWARVRWQLQLLLRCLLLLLLLLLLVADDRVDLLRRRRWRQVLRLRRRLLLVHDRTGGDDGLARVLAHARVGAHRGEVRDVRLVERLDAGRWMGGRCRLRDVLEPDRTVVERGAVQQRPTGRPARPARPALALQQVGALAGRVAAGPARPDRLGEVRHRPVLAPDQPAHQQLPPDLVLLLARLCLLLLPLVRVLLL